MSAATDSRNVDRAAEEFRSAARSFDARIRALTQSRWVFHEAAVRELIQYLADAAAVAEGQPRRPVPRLDSVFAVPDQFAVIAHDLDVADPSIDVYQDATRALQVSLGPISKKQG